MHIANINSIEAKNTRTPATIIAEVVSPARNNAVIIKVIKNPRRAANILGALSILFSLKLSALLKK